MTHKAGAELIVHPPPLSSAPQAKQTIDTRSLPLDSETKPHPRTTDRGKPDSIQATYSGAKWQSAWVSIQFPGRP